MASFIDELQKIAEGNVAEVAKPLVGGLGSNVMGKPLPTPGIGKGSATPLSPKPAKPTNYSMVNSTPPMAAFDGSSALKSVPPPSVS